MKINKFYSYLASSLLTFFPFFSTIIFFKIVKDEIFYFATDFLEFIGGVFILMATFGWIFIILAVIISIFNLKEREFKIWNIINILIAIFWAISSIYTLLNFA
jgi:hypothetical protein